MHMMISSCQSGLKGQISRSIARHSNRLKPYLLVAIARNGHAHPRAIVTRLMQVTIIHLLPRGQERL